MDPEFFEFADKNQGRCELDWLRLLSVSTWLKSPTNKTLVLLANVSRAIVPSEKTSNRVFREATQFEMDAGKEDFSAVADRDEVSTLRNVDNVYALDENLPGLATAKKLSCSGHLVIRYCRR